MYQKRLQNYSLLHKQVCTSRKEPRKWITAMYSYKMFNTHSDEIYRHIQQHKRKKFSLFFGKVSAEFWYQIPLSSELFVFLAISPVSERRPSWSDGCWRSRRGGSSEEEELAVPPSASYDSPGGEGHFNVAFFIRGHLLFLPFGSNGPQIRRPHWNLGGNLVWMTSP